MAKAKENPWIPSGGVLIVAVLAAVVAAILLNIYIGLIEAPYEKTVPFLALKQDVAKGEPVEMADLEVVEIAKPLVQKGYFERFARLEDRNLVTGEDARAQWDLRRGNLLAPRDVGEEVGLPVLKDLPEGYEQITIDIEPEPSVVTGVFVTVRGRFDMNPEDRQEQIEVLDVLYDVHVKAVEGSKEPDARRRSPDNIQIWLPKDYAKQLLQIKERMASDRFLVAVRQTPKGEPEPAFAPEALDLLRKPEPEPLLP